MPQSLSDRYREAPRAIQWLLIAVVGTVVFLTWDAYVRPIATNMAEEANAIEASVAEVRSANASERWLQKISSPAMDFGEVSSLSESDIAAAALNRTLNTILKEYISDESFKARPRGRLKSGVLPSMTKGRSRVQRWVSELKFTASPADAVSIIADLESHPDIIGVSEVRLTNPNREKIDVFLSVEAWAVLGSGSSA